MGKVVIVEGLQEMRWCILLMHARRRPVRDYMGEIACVMKRPSTFKIRSSLIDGVNYSLRGGLVLATVGRR